MIGVGTAEKTSSELVWPAVWRPAWRAGMSSMAGGDAGRELTPDEPSAERATTSMPVEAPASEMTLSSRRKLALVMSVVLEKVSEMASAWPASSCWAVEMAARRMRK